MKKTYQKPQIVFESFELSQNIAGGCNAVSNNTDGDVCSVNVPWVGGSINVFNNAGICEVYGPGISDNICYHAPGDMISAFSS